MKIESLARRIMNNADKFVFFFYPEIFFPKENVKHCAYIYEISHKQKIKKLCKSNIIQTIIYQNDDHDRATHSEDFKSHYSLSFLSVKMS